MRINSRGAGLFPAPAHRTLAVLAALTLALLALTPRPAAAIVAVDAATEVRAFHFRWTETKTLDERVLQKLLVTKERGGAWGLRTALGKLPMIDPPDPIPLDPMELQRDVVRLRGRYREAGFSQADVRYEVTLDDEANLVDVTFVITEGPPVILRHVDIAPEDSLAPLPVPAGQRGSWEKQLKAWRKLEGHRLDLPEARTMRLETENWWRDRGYPFARVRGRVGTDSTTGTRDLTVRIAPGRPGVFHPIEVDGATSISPELVEKRLPFKDGDAYSAKALEQAKRDVGELEIVRVALVETPAPPPRDSTSTAPPGTTSADTAQVAVRVRLTEAEPRLVSGQVGYGTEAGFTAEARWTHRNFLGGARMLTVSGVAQTGWWAVEDDPDKLYRASIAVTQPSFLARRMNGVLTPFIEQRDNVSDKSLQYGLNTTLIYRLAALRSIALDYQIARRRVDEYTLNDFAAGDIDLLTLLQYQAQGFLDSLGTVLWNSTFTLSGTVGTIDNPAKPRRGVVLRPAFQVTAPRELASTNFTRLDVGLHAYYPLPKRMSLAGRVSVGRLYPFGKSLPATGDDPSVKFLQLRDVLFTAGGTDDVRGWGDRLLGPKFPDVRAVPDADTTQLVADDFVPLGGFERATWSLELRAPLAGFANWSWHVFLDAGRVRTEDDRFAGVGDEAGDEGWFYGTGAGLDLGTPVGPIKLDVGYKLNPSTADLVDSGDLLEALVNETPTDTLERKNSRRWQFHLAFGTSF